MNLQAQLTLLENILPFRQLFLQETNFQIRYNAVHERSWADSYLLTAGGTPIGYGAIKGKKDLMHRDAVFEFYLLPTHKKMASTIFPILLNASRAIYIECQSNDIQLLSMLYEYAKNINADVILFADDYITNYERPDLIFRARKEKDVMSGVKPENMGAYVLEKEGIIVATAGFLLHYNKPFADLYMEVHPDYRRQGLGSYILQEIKKECYRHGRVPAARCNITNLASKATLLKAGLKVAGYMLTGKVKGK